MIETSRTSTTSTVERLAELEGFGEISARNLVAAIEASQEAALRPGAVRARHPRDRLRQRAQSGPPLAFDGRADRRHGGAARRGRGRRADHGQDHRRDARRGPHARAGRAAARSTGCRWRRRARRAVPRGRWWARRSCSPGTLPNLTREDATERDRGGGRQGHRLGVEEDRLRGGRRGSRGRS